MIHSKNVMGCHGCNGRALSAELDNARDALKLTYEELAERTGMSQSTVHSALRILWGDMMEADLLHFVEPVKIGDLILLNVKFIKTVE